MNSPLTSSRLRHPRSTRGSGIVMAIIFSSVLSIVLASMLRWVMTESKLNQRAMLRLEARNAAEAVAEYGMCQIRYKMDNTSTFLANSFTPSGSQPITAPGNTLFSGTHVQSSATGVFAGRINNVTSSGSALLYFVDANDPNNINDPLKGKWVFRRDIPVYAKATVTATSGPAISAYVCEKISVRGAPLFAHAMFYNMDMELAPGATMNIYGPVHANGDVYVSSQGASVNFYNTLTCTGNIYHAWKSYILTAQGQTNGSSGEGLNMTSDVTFKTRLNTQVSMDQSGTWKDSTMGYSTTVKTNNSSGVYTSQAAYTAALLGAANSNVNPYKTFASTTWNGNVQTSANGVQNYTPVAIGKYVEDPTPTNGVDNSVNTGRLLIEPPTSILSAQYSAEVESQKYSNQAGLYIQIVPASSGGSTTTTSGGNTTVTTNDPPLLGQPSITVKAGGPNGTVALSVPANLVKYYPYKQTAVTNSGNTTYTVNRGMYDQRRNAGADLVELDIGVLKDAIAQMQLPLLSRNSSKAISSLETSAWTGIIYLEVTGNPTTKLDGTTVDAVTGDKVAIRIINGNTPVPTYGAMEGLTIATNAPLYIKGNYNDDGSGTASASVSKTGEKPAAFAADSVTLLSPNFNDATSRSAIRPDASSDIVVAAAILTGIAPTNKDGSARMSGGAHNLVRFLEDWSGPSKAVYIRGSLVALFESRVASEPWRIDYYSAPVRNWGFCDLLVNGRYPPGTPRVISYRRTDYGDMTKAQYDAALAGL